MGFGREGMRGSRRSPGTRRHPPEHIWTDKWARSWRGEDSCCHRCRFLARSVSSDPGMGLLLSLVL